MLVQPGQKPENDRVNDSNAYLSYAMAAVVQPMETQWYILPRYVSFQFVDPGGMECMVGLGGKSQQEPGIECT